MFVIKHPEKGLVSKPGRKSSYTMNYLHAQLFHTREEAERNKCGDEFVFDIGYNNILTR